MHTRSNSSWLPVPYKTARIKLQYSCKLANDLNRSTGTACPCSCFCLYFSCKRADWNRPHYLHVPDHSDMQHVLSSLDHLHRSVSCTLQQNAVPAAVSLALELSVTGPSTSSSPPKKTDTGLSEDSCSARDFDPTLLTDGTAMIGHSGVGAAYIQCSCAMCSSEPEWSANGNQSQAQQQQCHCAEPGTAHLSARAECDVRLCARIGMRTRTATQSPSL
jgi:hypothetical protein